MKKTATQSTTNQQKFWRRRGFWLSILFVLLGYLFVDALVDVLRNSDGQVSLSRLASLIFWGLVAIFCWYRWVKKGWS